MQQVNVLVASADTVHAPGLVRILEGLGARVRRASDGHEMQRLLSPSNAIGCVLVDAQLSGWRRLIGRHRRTILPAILLGHSVPPDILIEAWRAGFADCIALDADLAVVSSAIVRALRGVKGWPGRSMSSHYREAMEAWAEPFVERILGGAVQLPAIPDVIRKLDEESRNTQWTWASLAAIAADDGSVVARVIDLSNRADMSGRGSTLADHVSRVGLVRLRVEIVRSAFEQLFRVDESPLGGTFRQVWRKHQQAAILARAIAGDSEDAYLHAITYRVGEIYLLKEYSLAKPKAQFDAEGIAQLLDVIGAQQSMVGAAIFEAWGFERSFVAVARFQHRPEYISDAATRRLTVACILAWRLVESVGLGYPVDAQPGPDVTRCYDLLGVSHEERANWHSRACRLVAPAD